MVISWITNGLSTEIRRSVIYTDTTQGIWTELENRYGKLGGAQLYSIQKQLSSLSQGANTISEYFSAMKSLWDEIDRLRTMHVCNCDAMSDLLKYEQDQRLMHFLMGLNEVYVNARGAILMRTNLPKIREVYSILMEEEKQRGISNGDNLSEGATSFLAKSQSTHGRGKRFCTNCKKSNHNVDKCFHIIGFPPRKYKQTDSTQTQKFVGVANSLSEFSADQISQFMSMLQTVSREGKAGSILKDDFAGFSGISLQQMVFDQASWIIDSGASSHMCCDLSLFKDFAETFCYQFAN